MAKKHFQASEMIAIWLEWDHVCVICERPIESPLTLSIDHVIPEDLEDKPDDLAEAIKKYGLASDFKINDFPNWVPTHPKCNSRKGSTLLDSDYSMSMFLARAKRIGEKARNRYADFKKHRDLAKQLALMDERFRSEKPSREDMLLLRDFVAKTERLAPIETRLQVDPARWKIARVNQSGVADVTDGRVTGCTALFGYPLLDPERWRCERCGGWGPFSLDDMKCLSCDHNPMAELRKYFEAKEEPPQ